MMRGRHVVLAAAITAATGGSATAQVLDATYRGTMICDKLPFTGDKMREAIEVTIAGSNVSYNHVVRLGKADAELTSEHGTGGLDGPKITLQGSWKSGNRGYEAKYAGSFVRRSAQLKGVQIWTADGNTVTRNCTGVIKRPFKPFLPDGQR